jgi:hypothetical protein
MSFVIGSAIGFTVYISKAFRMGGCVASGVATSEKVCRGAPCTILLTASAERYLGVKPRLPFHVALSTRISNCRRALRGNL